MTISLCSAHIQSSSIPKWESFENIENIFSYFENNQLTTFTAPTMLLSRHTNILKSFNLITHNHYCLTITWQVILLNKSITEFHENHEYLTKFEISLEPYYFQKVIGYTFADGQICIQCHTKIAIHNHKLVKDLFIGITPYSYNNLLIFHFYSNWDHNVAYLHLYFLSKIQHFFRHIVISFAHDSNKIHLRQSFSEEMIKKFIDSKHITILHKTNHKRAGESISFHSLLSHIESYQHVFYAHSKGMRHNNNQAVLYWIIIMYYVNISNFNEMLYANYSLGGCFISKIPFDLTHRYPWHYSGSFYWIHVTALLSNIMKIRNDCRHFDYYLTEKFPSMILPSMRNCIDFINTSLSIRYSPQQRMCPLYDSNFYHIHFPYFITIFPFILESIQQFAEEIRS